MSVSASASPPVGIFVGRSVDDSTAPPTYERNRYVADLILNYACYPFLSGPDNVLTISALRPTQGFPASNAASTVRAAHGIQLATSPIASPPFHSSDGRPALSPKAYAAPSLSIWDSNATARFSGVTHLWYAEPLPPVGIEEMCAFHDEAYVRYLSVRECLSEVDEFGSVAKRRRAESRQPTTSSTTKRSSVIAAIEGDPIAAQAIAADPHPPRFVPDLEPLPSDDEFGLNHDATPFVGMWKTIQATVSGTLTAVRWLTDATARAAEEEAPRSTTVLLPPPSSSSSYTAAATANARTTPDRHHTVLTHERVPSDLSPLPKSGVTPLDVQCLDAHSNSESTAELPSPNSLVTPSTATPSPMLHRVVPAASLQRPIQTLGNRWAALHWFGGRHHAMRDAASAFCYVNDVVLGAMAMHKALPAQRNKVLIIDLDAHHGDGTQTAFLYDPNYYTLSVHAYGLGLFPHTGAATEIGKGAGVGYTANVALPEGATDHIMVPLVRQAVKAAIHKLGDALGAIVLVCGADGLQGDEVGKLNYTIAGLQCVTRLVIEKTIELGVKLLVLGAGGYVDTSTARLSSVVTRDVLSAAAALQQIRSFSADQLATYDLDLFFASPALTNLGVPVPDSSAYFTHYGPSFLMHGLPGAKVPKVDHLEQGQPYYNTLRALREKGTSSRRTSVTSVM